MKRLVIGIMAHVDSGKTTLAEGMLFRSGEIRKLGRVDHQDAFLDTHALERARGITIFSKQAVLHLGDTEITLLDTPGHVDFSPEMERTLQVLDYAILVVSGSDGIQSHTETLWKLLAHYRIPTFLFINKMDLPGKSRDKLLTELQSRLDGHCLDFGADWEDLSWQENAAVCDESLMEHFLSEGSLGREDLAAAILRRSIFPCYFGSALRLEGVEELLAGIESCTTGKSYPAAFGAKVFKISQDEQGGRLTHLKITGGSLKVKTVLEQNPGQPDGWSEKVNQLRVYSGAKYQMIEEASAGMICAVTGLNHTYPGQGLGGEPDSELPVLQPVLTYRVILPDGMDAHTALVRLRQLEQEEPALHVLWNEALGEIHVQIMGDVQLEILQSLLQSRFGMAVSFGQGNILYKETIARPVEGVGHYEPLRHYAEVHLLLEPGKSGSGLQFACDCREEVLDKNWQRLILTHLQEKEHVGVLTGSPVTDLKITLVSGRAHQKHTEGGDFRQATYRAVRQGLKSAESVLLEPYYDFSLSVPAEMIGRAMSDLQRMEAEFSPPNTFEDTAVIEGSAPAACMRGYQMEVTGYTRGKGRLSCRLKGYGPCHNAQEIIDAVGYDSENDLENPTGSVFCAHGGGFYVKWDEVPDYMHLPSILDDRKPEEALPEPPAARQVAAYCATLAEDAELMRIFERTYGPIKRDPRAAFRPVRKEKPEKPYKAKDLPEGPEYLLVDGYNIIFAWDDLSRIAAENIDAARNRLVDILCNYRGVRQCEVILVFDAYKVKGNPGSVEKIHNISVVYTKEAETADMYIEKVTHEIGKKHPVRVATSDSLEQIIILGHGAYRVSAAAFREEVDQVEKAIRDFLSQ